MLPNQQNNQIGTGKVLLTKLTPARNWLLICGSAPIEGFFEFVCERWASQSLIPKKKPKPSPQSGN
jgi:hypothetical protein